MSGLEKQRRSLRTCRKCPLPALTAECQISEIGRFVCLAELHQIKYSCNCESLVVCLISEYHKYMDKHLEQYLALCQCIFERMEREGSWPWAEGEGSRSDSTLGENLIDSDHNQ